MMISTLKLNASIPLVLLAAVSCTGNQGQNEQSATELPNIILLMGDDHGFDEVGYYGHPYVQTPVLDEMASQGLRFDRFYAAHSTCSPTRGSIITGRHANRYGTFGPNWSMRPEEISIAHLLKDAGYSTAHFGKWHVGPIKKESPTGPGAMGFDEWLSHDNFFEIDPVLSRNGETPQTVPGESSAILIDETIRFIEKSKEQDKPFFALVWYGSPHEPYVALPEDLALYENIPDSLNNEVVGVTSLVTGRSEPQPRAEVLKKRYAEITAMDRSIGMLRDYLAQNGLKENTIVLYCSDNGSPEKVSDIGITLRNGKGSMYEGGIRVSAVMEWPAQIKQPGTTSAILTTTDFLPTIAELTNQPLPDRPLDGISMLPFFQDTTLQRNTPHFFWQFNRDLFDNTAELYIPEELQEGTTPLAKMMNGKFTRTFRNCVYSDISEDDFQGQRAMINKPYKLIIEGTSPNEEGYELYDIFNDPEETINLANELPETVEEMKLGMRQWQESVLNSLTGADYSE
jgi:arylsulfatase A-like enzyme